VICEDEANGDSAQPFNVPPEADILRSNDRLFKWRDSVADGSRTRHLEG
jgi:hypothetical protein